MRMLRFVVYGALALAAADPTAAFGAGPGAKVLQEVQAPDLGRRQDNNFAPNAGNTFVVSADLRPSASVVRPVEQRPVFEFPPQQQQQQVVSRPLPPPPQAPSQFGPPPVPQGGPQFEPQGGPFGGPQGLQQGGPQLAPRPQAVQTFEPQANQPLRQPVLPATDSPILDQATVDVRQINPPFLEQYNEDGTVYQPPPPPPPQQPQQQQQRPQQPLRRPPPRFRRPPPPFGRPQGPSGPLGQPLQGRPPVRPRPPIFRNPLQQLQQRIFGGGRPPARVAPNRRRFRRDLSEVEVSPDVKQDRTGRWAMEYAMRKAADPASVKDHGEIPEWAPMDREARARLDKMFTNIGKQGLAGSEDLPIKITEVVADSPEEARIPIRAGDEVVIVRVPEENLNVEDISIEAARLLNYRESRARRVEGVSERQGRADDTTPRSDQPWWARIPLLSRLIYKPMPGEEGTPSYTPNGEATPVAAEDRAGYDTEAIVSPLYDPYLSVDANGNPYYRTPTHAALAHYEHIPDVEKHTLNPTDEYVIPDNFEDPFRGGYTPFRPGYQYVTNVPYLPAPYYPPGDVKYHRRQQLIPEEIDFLETTQKRSSDEGAQVAAREAETAEEAAAEAESVDSGLEQLLAQAAQSRTGEIAIIDTGDHYAVVSGDISKFVDFDGETGTASGSTKARSLADLLKLSESSKTSAAHSRTKRQAGLYPLLAPIRRPQRRPIQRRDDDFGRFPQLPTFRPPWESGRRVPNRPRGPRPFGPVSQRPNTRQPTTSFQPPLPQPVFEQHEQRPAFHQQEERPVFEHHGARPVFHQQEGRPVFEQQQNFEQHNVQPTFQQPNEGQRFEQFEQFESRPQFEQHVATPEYEQQEAHPTFHEPDSRPTIEQPGNDIITGPTAQFGGFQPVTGPAPGAEQQTGEAIFEGQPRPVVSPVRVDPPRLTVITTVPAPAHTEAVFVRPSRPVNQNIQPATQLVTDQHPQQQLAASEQHQLVVSSSFNSQPSVPDNQVTEEDKPSGSWASAALAGLSAILGGSSETTPEPVPVTTPSSTPEDQPKNEGIEVHNQEDQTPTFAPQNVNDEETNNEKEKPAVKVIKRYQKRQRRPTTSAAVSRKPVHRDASHSNNSPTYHRRRQPTATHVQTSNSDATEAEVKPAAPTAPKQRVTFGARVRPTAGQRRRRPVARHPTTKEPEPIPTPTTSTPEPVTVEASESVRQTVVRLPTGDEHIEVAESNGLEETPSAVHETVPTLQTTQATHQPTTNTPQPTAAPEVQEVSVDAPSTGGFRPVAGPPRHRSVPPPSRGGRPIIRYDAAPVVSETRNVEVVPSKDHQEETKPEPKGEEEKVDDVHSQLESYLSRYAEKYGLGLVTSSPRTPRPTPSDKPAAPVSGLRWAHLAARSRSATPAEGDELDEFVTGEPDGDERLSVGSQYSYRVELPPSRRVPPSALNSVRLRPKSKLAHLLGSSPRLRPSTAKPTIPWPAGYQPFTVSSTTPRPGRWAARRERLTTPSPTAAPAPTTGPAWSKYADEFTTTQRPTTTTEESATSGTRSRPIYIPPINRKRYRTRPLNLHHAGPRRTEDATTTTEETPVAETEELTEAPAVTIPAPPPVTQEISPETFTTVENVETTTDSAFSDEVDPLVASSEEPVGESSLFSVVYSKERPHVKPPQPEIFSRLNQFLAAHGEQPPTAPATVSVTVGTSPIRVPVVPVSADSEEDVDEFQASVHTVPVAVSVQEDVEEETDGQEVPALVTDDGTVIVQAVPAEAEAPSSSGAWVPTVQAVAITPGGQAGTVVVYPEHMSQAEREQHWPEQQALPQPDQQLDQEEQQQEEDGWFEEPDSVHDLDLSHDGLVEEVVYLEDAEAAALGKAARLDDAASEAEFLVPVVSDVPAEDDVDDDEAEVVKPVHDPYGVFWTGPSSATNAEQAESQQLAGAFAAEDEADVAEVVDPTDAPAEQEGEAVGDDRTVNLCLDGKCMFIYEPGRQVRVSGENEN